MSSKTKTKPKKKTLQERIDEADETPGLEENLVLVAFAKQKGTDAQPGYKIRLQSTLPAGAVTPGNEKDPLLPKHGVLSLTSRNMFEGVRKIVMTGKLKITRTAAKKESPAFQTWEFRLANVPTFEHACMLLELACANGEESQAMVEAVFIEKEEPRGVQVSDGPELFGDEEEIERIKSGEILDDFDQGQEANVVPGSDAADMVENAKLRKVD